MMGALLRGPFACASRWLTLTGIVLTVLVSLATQIGGVVVWIAIGAATTVKSRSARFLLVPAVSMAAYAAISVLLLPVLAALGDRVPLPCFDSSLPLKPRSAIFCVANRHYVATDLAPTVRRIAESYHSKTGKTVTYLDAGFPFGGGFPMLPHLSHGDGRKIDLAFSYDDTSNSPIGYFGFVQPEPGAALPCVGREGLLRWNLEWLQPLLPPAELDVASTVALIEEIVSDPEVQKVFLEPHLKSSWGLHSDKIRFQGCNAARHDDHIHVDA